YRGPTIPPPAQEAARPASPASSRTTSCPALASKEVESRPMTPPPTTTVISLATFPPPAGSHIHAFSIDLSTRCSTTSLSFIAGPTATAAERKAHSPGWRHMINAKEPHHAEQGSRLHAC